jgi:biotin carboxylase
LAVERDEAGVSQTTRRPRLGPEEVVLVGFSRTLLVPLADVLPPRSVLVVEEPDIALKRDVDALAREHPAIARVTRCEYQRPGAIAGLIGDEPAVKAARAVLPGVEYAVAAAGELAERLGLPGAGARAGLVFRDKASQRETAAASGIRNPEYAVVTSADEAIAFLNRVGRRCVVKPTARQASLGVCFVATPDDVRAAVAEATSVRESLLEPDRGIPSRLLVEAAVDGDEYSVEMLVARGRPVFANVTAKRLLLGTRPVELGHVVPAGAPEELTRSLVDGTARLAAGAGFGDGVLHCEWIVDDLGPVLVECAARMPGDEIGNLISLAYGFPVFHAYLDALLGAPVETPSGAPAGAAIRFLTATPGQVVAVTGVDTARAQPGVTAVKVTARPGDVVGAVASSWDRAGYVVARGSTGADAEARAVAAAGMVAIETRPG